MRIRIQTFSPLPELKAWFIPEIQDAHETVFDLKELLCKGIPQLRANQIDARYLILLLEGFELLNDSPISAVRDGDLIIVKMPQRTKEYVDEPPSHSRKRKRNPNEFEDKSPIKVSSSRGAPTPQASSAYQNVSQSSESEQSSSSDSEPNTSDSSSDSSSSTSSSDSSPTTHPVNNVIIPPQLGKHQLSRDRPPKTTHIPPGQGKPSTHSRNKRRRKKREHDKLAKAVLPTQPKGISEANNLPLGHTRTENIIDSSSITLSASLPQSSSSKELTLDATSIPHENDRGSSSKYVHITPDQVMMGSLRNKNKKKGFKQAMTGPIHRKIIFSEGAEQEQPNESNPVSDDYTPRNLGGQQSSEANRIFHRLIPPSELQDLGQLPPNVFVTSVDVEEHIWGSHNGLPKKKKGNKRKDMFGYDEGGGYGFEEQGGEGCDEDLTYGEGAQTEEKTSGIDWDKAEGIWEASSPIQDIQQLKDGVVFGWKELAINPQTFTPEMLLFLARIISVTHEGIDNERNTADVLIRFRQLQRPGASEAAVAFGVAAGGGEGAEAGDDMGEEERAAWSDVLEGQWRLVDI